MALDRKTALADIDAVLAHQPPHGGTSGVSEVVALYRACIDRWSPVGSTYRAMADRVDIFPEENLSRPEQHMRAVLVALRRDYDAGMVKTFEEIVHATVFGGLLDQADHLASESYLLAAAVVSGAALEAHLRDLATKHGLVLETVDAKGKKSPKMATALNTELRSSAKAYTLPEERQVQVWIDYRNEAAHNKPEFRGRTQKDISGMISGIRDFIVRYPA